MKFPNIPENWRDPETMGAIIADPSDEFPETLGYGGHLICESVQKRYRPLIVAAPKMLAALLLVLDDWGSPVSHNVLDEDVESINRQQKIVADAVRAALPDAS